MSVKKKTKTILECTCELPDCGKSWESKGDEIPDRCRWCLSRTWNGEGKTVITFNGETKTIKDWAIHTGMSAPLIRARIIKFGWTPEDALTIPAGVKRNEGA